MHQLAIEQLWARGEVEAAVGVVLDLDTPDEAAWVMVDFAQRLDLGWAGYSTLPHDGVPGGSDIYRFE